MTDAFSVERRGAVAVFHLDDGKANALSFDMISSIRSALAEAEADEEVGAVVVHGRPASSPGASISGSCWGTT